MSPNKQLVVEKALKYLAEEAKTGEYLQSVDAVRAYLRLRLGGREHEVFAIVFLNNQHQVIDTEELFRGTLSQTSVYPREVAIEALKRNASAVILCHNHPSGNPEPSHSDRALTKKLQEALALVDVRVLDHLIVTQTQAVSFAEMGLL